jgi:hypothetical protein
MDMLPYLHGSPYCEEEERGFAFVTDSAIAVRYV